jgi:hypothetical protein
LMGSIRRECLDHVIVLNQAHLQCLLKSYFAYYHRSRTHLGLDKDAPGTTTSAGSGGGQDRRAPPSGRPAPSLRTPGGLRSRLLPPTDRIPRALPAV